MSPFFSSFILGVLAMIWFSSNLQSEKIEMDVKCTVYDNTDNVNGNNVDVRIFVMGLKEGHEYTLNVQPDHNPPSVVTAKTDYEGLLWTVAKIPNGEKSLLFSVNVYEGNGTNGRLISSGNDDAPCHHIFPSGNNK